MPDPVRLSAALFVAAALAALMSWVCRGRWMPAGQLLGMATAYYAGCRVLGLWPHWPPREDQDRLLICVLPAVVATELLAAFPRTPRRLVHALRLIVAAGTARVLIEGTLYVCHAAGPESRVWSTGQVWSVLGTLALALGVVWWALVALEKGPLTSRSPCAWRWFAAVRV